MRPVEPSHLLQSFARRARRLPEVAVQDMAELPSTQAAPNAARAAPRRSWSEVLRVYLEPPVLRMLLLGFSAGLPLLLVLGTLSFRLREAGIGRATMGYLSWRSEEHTSELQS